jgi:hypothetical protein
VDIYGRDGKPISLEEFAAVPRKKRLVKKNTFMLQREPILVLTEWDGRDMSDGEASVPCPFSTVVLSESYPNMMMAVPDEKKARVSHEMMCGFVRAQGGKAGWRTPLHFAARGWARPKSVKLGWFQLALCVAVVMLQLMPLTMSAITWNWDWADLLPAAALLLYGWFGWNSLRGLKRLLQERREERRIAAEKETFDKIVGQIES